MGGRLYPLLQTPQGRSLRRWSTSANRLSMSTPIRTISVIMLIAAAAALFLFSACPHWPTFGPLITQVANWGSGSLTPTVWPTSVQVMMTPTVVHLGQPGPFAQVVFVSFTSAADAAADGNGVLRVIDRFGVEIARFPDTSIAPLPVPATCSNYSNLGTVPHLSPVSGLAIGKLQANQPPTIIGVLDDHLSNQAGLIAFQLTASGLVPIWCSQPLTAGDTIPRISAPAIAQLDAAGSPPLIVVDNKVYDFAGKLRFSGGSCASCSHSRTPIVANVAGAPLPQVIAGNTIYTSSPGTVWSNPSVTTLSGISATAVTYAAVADMDQNGQPEIVLVDGTLGILHVFSAAGTAFVPAVGLPPGNNASCGGPPMIGDADGIAGPEIGVATCSRYTVFKYASGGLSQLWAVPYVIKDLSGHTTSTLFKDPTGVARIYYGDGDTLRVFNAKTGALLQSVPTTSATAIEGPIIASFDTGGGAGGVGRLILAASNYGVGPTGFTGIRIFTDPGIGPARGIWNQHTYHHTNVASSFGNIPTVEPSSWLPPVNSYRVQQ